MTDTDKEREERIHNEIMVDAYVPEEQSLSWYYYLEEKLTFPFKAECVEEKRISPLKKGEKIEVIGLASEEDCESDMLVMIKLLERTFGVPLSQLKPLNVSHEAQEAIEDWHYWIGQGYQF